MIYRANSIVLFLLVISLALTGCVVKQEPPSIDQMQHLFGDNCADIQVVIEYMIASNYDSIHIAEFLDGIDYKKYDGTIWADFNIIRIESQKTIESLQNLLSSEFFLQISKTGNTINFMCWQAFPHDVNCGIAYSINGVDKPEIQYAIQIEPLNEKGWYYYVEDYEEWRANKT